jgi:hypothetical protein
MSAMLLAVLATPESGIAGPTISIRPVIVRPVIVRPTLGMVSQMLDVLHWGMAPRKQNSNLRKTPATELS